MKSHQLYLTFILLFCSLGINAQELYNNQVSLQNVTCEQAGKLLHVSMDANAIKANVSSREALVLTPVIKLASNEKELPAIVISGGNRYKADRRAHHFGDDVAYKLPYTVVKSNSDSSTHIGYRYSVLFEPWMTTAHLEMKEEVYGCASCKNSEKRYSVASVKLEIMEPKKPEGKPAVSYVKPVVEAVKNRNMEGKAYLEFPAGKAVILTDFRNNFKELSKVDNDINLLKNDPDAVINSITLKGFASPEGSYAVNTRLSEERSQALKTYLQKEHSYRDKMFRISSESEDWNGLRELVEASELAQKQAMLNIINGKGDFDAKERKLKALKGNGYKELLEKYFPQLRRVDYKLAYTIRAFSVEEGKEIVKTRPGQMSLNEMFLVANTYPKGSDDFNRVFDVAVRMFPKDTVANINAAAIALEKGDLAAAHRYLDPLQQTSDSWNNQGVLYMMEGSYTKAKDFFTKAQSRGSSEAEQNIKLLELLQSYKEQKEAYDTARNPHVQ